MLAGIGEEREVAAEFVHDHAESARAIGIAEQLPRPGNLREDAAALNVGDEQPSAIEMMRRAQVHDIAGHEIQLDGAARPFEHQDVAAGFPDSSDSVTTGQSSSTRR